MRCHHSATLASSIGSQPSGISDLAVFDGFWPSSSPLWPETAKSRMRSAFRTSPIIVSCHHKLGHLGAAANLIVIGLLIVFCAALARRIARPRRFD